MLPGEDKLDCRVATSPSGSIPKSSLKKYLVIYTSDLKLRNHVFDQAGIDKGRQELAMRKTPSY